MPVSLAVEDVTLERLLDPGDPALRARVLVDLPDDPEQSPAVIDARSRIPQQPWARATLAAHKGDGTSWVLLHLSEVGAPMDLPPIRKGVEHLIQTARPISQLGGVRGVPSRELAHGAYWMHPIACLTAHMALVLIRVGPAEHAVTRGALAVRRHRFRTGRGFGCFVMEDSLLPACVMTVPKVLKAFLALPPGDPGHAIPARFCGAVDEPVEAPEGPDATPPRRPAWVR